MLCAAARLAASGAAAARAQALSGAAAAMYPAAPRHNACLGPGVVSAAQMPLEAAAAYARAAGPALIQPCAGGPAFSVTPCAPNTHTQCVRLRQAAGRSANPRARR